MSAMFNIALPLPVCLEDRNAITDHRRHRIGTVELDARAIDRFNRLLERVGRQGTPLDADRLATAARELRGHHPALTPPACIRQRINRVKAAVAMIEDRAWRAPDEAVATVRLVAEYVAATDDLIPDTMPTVGRLDDSIVVDAAWPRLANEILGYVDYRRLRRLFAATTGDQLRFDRAAWQQARAEESALRAQLRRVRMSSFCVPPPPLFRVC
jgi:uncharacterized membrane protein YkvA (DUF1232 family)